MKSETNIAALIEKTQGISLDDIDISTRLRNCLKRGGYQTLTEITVEPIEKLSTIRNMGSISERELFELREFINDADREEIEKLCINSIGAIPNSEWKVLEIVVGKKLESFIVVFDVGDGYIQEDIEIDSIKFSKRALDALKELNADTIKKVAVLTCGQICSIKGLGSKTVDEIINQVRKHAIVSEIDRKDEQVINYMVNAALDFYRPIIKRTELLQRRELLISAILQAGGLSSEVGNEQLISLSNHQPINNLIREEILLYASDNILAGVDRDYLESVIASNELHYKVIISSIIDQMIRDKQLREIHGKLYKYKMFLDEWIASLEGNTRIVIDNRCKGLTLEETGNKLNLTRERVRQIASKAIKQKPLLYEDDYSYYIQKYNFSSEEISLLFDLGASQINYLLMVYSRGENDVQSFIEDSSVPDSIIERVPQAFKDKMILIDGIYVPLKRDALLKQLLKTFFPNEDLSIDDIESFYEDFLNKNELANCKQVLFSSSRSLEARIIDYPFTLAKSGRRIRYYDTTTIDINVFLKELDIDRYNNLEISTAKIFSDFPAVMDSYDIRDEYELHNLIRKKIDDINGYVITVTRMPFICVGNGDRNKQVKDLLYQMSPVSIVQLSEEYERRYGVRSDTVIANFFKDIDVFYHDGVFDVGQPRLSEEEYRLLKSELVEDFYTWDDVVNTYLRMSNDPQEKAINAMTLKQLGFKVYSQYVVSANYSSAESYFKKLLLEKEILDLNKLPNGTKTIQSYYSALNELKDSLEIIEFSKDCYYRYDYFANQYSNASKNELKRMKEVVLSRIEKEDYFSVEVISSSNIVEDLPPITRNPYILNSILRIDPSIKTGRIANTYIGARGDNELSQIGLINHIIKTEGEMSISSLMQILENHYSIHSDTSKILHLLTKSKDLAYDEIFSEVCYVENNSTTQDSIYLESSKVSHIITESHDAIMKSNVLITSIYWKDKFSSFVEYCASRDLFQMKDLLKLNFKSLYNEATSLSISKTTISVIIATFTEWISNITQDNISEDQDDIMDVLFK